VALAYDPAVGLDPNAMDAFGLGAEDRAAWLATGLSEEAFDDWLMDRVARRPRGTRAREVYGAEDVHDFARLAILDALAPGLGDRLIDIGCGGGLLLRDAIGRGAEATGVDHSDDMVVLARKRAPAAAVVLAAAEALPFGENAFTAVSMSIVFVFLPHPLAALRESRRVLAPGGRLAVYTTSEELRGTPAAPEPFASRAFFHSDAELIALAKGAGFGAVSVDRHDGAQLLTGRALRSNLDIE
jgi:SAM-dependent methyltransferase